MIVECFLKLFDDFAASADQIPAIRRLMFASVLHAAVSAPDADARAEALRDSHALKRGKPSKIACVSSEELPPSLAGVPATLFERLENIASIDKGQSQIQSTKPGRYPLVVTAEARSTSETGEFEGPAAIVPLVSSTGHGDASLKRIHYQEGKYAVGNILAVIRPISPSEIRARFLYEYLSSFKDELLVSRMVGTANVSLTINKLKEVPVPLVSGEALNRIDELMALCDRLEAQQKEREAKHAGLARAALARFAEAPTPANLAYLFHDAYAIDPADIRKSILTMAVQGKLVVQNAKDGGVSMELAAAAANLSVKKRDRSPTALPPIEEAPYEIPHEWRWARFQEVAFIASNLVDPNGFLDALHLAPDNVEKGNGVLLPCRTIREDKVKSGKHRFYAGQLVYSKIRPNLSKVVVVDFEGLCSADMYPIDPLVDGRYLQKFMLSESFLAQAVKSDTRVAMPKINQEELNAIAIAVPPLAEQRRIVAKVEQLMAHVDELEAQLVASRVTAAKLMEAVLANLRALDAGPVLSTSPQPKPADLIEIKPTDLHAGILAMASALHERHGAGLQFTHVKAEKIAHMIEALLGIDLGRNPVKDAAGPNDFNHLKKVEYRAAKANFFDFKKIADGPYQLKKLRGFDRLIERTRTALGDRLPEVEKLLNWMLPMNWQQAEIVATIYAAWNNLLLDGIQPTDEQIVHESRENWHSEKLKIDRDRFFKAIQWLRQQEVVPSGTGKRVVARHLERRRRT